MTVPHEAAVGNSPGTWTSRARTAPVRRGARPQATVVVIGLDPGVTTGVGFIGPGREALAYQCSAAAAYGLVAFLMEANDGPATVLLGGERFIAGRGPGARGASAAVTRKVIEDVDGLGDWAWRSAAEVKPWASLRLEAAGLYSAAVNMPHARDAMMHALFAAVADGGMPDPLSKEGRAFWRSRGQSS